MESRKDLPGSSAKKRKLQEIDKYKELTEEDAFYILPEMELLLGASMEEQDQRVLSSNSSHSEILELKDLVAKVHAMKQALDAYSNRVYKELLHKTEPRIRGLFDSTSPLLSLDESVLKHAIGYLDEEGLVSLEQASTTVQRYFSKSAWVDLDNQRRRGTTPGFFPISKKQSSRSVSRFARLKDVCHEERGQIFVKAAQFARKMEVVCARHYDYDQKTKSGAMVVNCSGCQELDQMSSCGRVLTDYHSNHGDAIFVRFSYRERPKQGKRYRNPLIWQGFVDHEKTETPYSFGKYSEEVVINMDDALEEMDWPELKAHMKWLNEIYWPSPEERARKEGKTQLERLAANLVVTVVLVPTLQKSSGQVRMLLSQDAAQGEGNYLMMATGGCSSPRKGEDGHVYLQPRNKEPHDKKWVPTDFLESNFAVETQGTSSFHLTLLSYNL